MGPGTGRGPEFQNDGVGEEFGEWGLALGVNMLRLGEGAKAIDGGDSGTKVIALFGLSVGY